MKKVFITLGAIFLIVIVTVAAVIGFAAYNGNKLDSASKAYVDQNIPPIISSWSPEELMRRSSPELKSSVTPQQFAELFKTLSQLGSLKTYESAQGDSNMSYTTQNGKMITAEYTAHAEFTNGKAELKIKLIQHDGQWQLLGFHVNSPLFSR